jgi:hypothetical protein
MLGRFRERLGGAEPIPAEVPAWMVRDIGLPLFSRVATPASYHFGLKGINVI